MPVSVTVRPWPSSDAGYSFLLCDDNDVARIASGLSSPHAYVGDIFLHNGRPYLQAVSHAFEIFINNCAEPLPVLQGAVLLQDEDRLHVASQESAFHDKTLLVKVAYHPSPRAQPSDVPSSNNFPTAPRYVQPKLPISSTPLPSTPLPTQPSASPSISAPASSPFQSSVSTSVLASIPPCSAAIAVQGLLHDPGAVDTRTHNSTSAQGSAPATCDPHPLSTPDVNPSATASASTPYGVLVDRLRLSATNLEHPRCVNTDAETARSFAIPHSSTLIPTLVHGPAPLSRSPMTGARVRSRSIGGILAARKAAARMREAWEAARGVVAASMLAAITNVSAVESTHHTDTSFTSVSTSVLATSAPPPSPADQAAHCRRQSRTTKTVPSSSSHTMDLALSRIRNAWIQAQCWAKEVDTHARRQSSSLVLVRVEAALGRAPKDARPRSFSGKCVFVRLAPTPALQAPSYPPLPLPSSASFRSRRPSGRWHRQEGRRVTSAPRHRARTRDDPRICSTCAR